VVQVITRCTGGHVVETDQLDEALEPLCAVCGHTLGVHQAVDRSDHEYEPLDPCVPYCEREIQPHPGACLRANPS
jgi:hypothetical protein